MIRRDLADLLRHLADKLHRRPTIVANVAPWKIGAGAEITRTEYDCGRQELKLTVEVKPRRAGSDVMVGTARLRQSAPDGFGIPEKRPRP